MEPTHHRLIDFVQVPIKPYAIRLAGSCDGATVGPSFFVCGTFSAPDIGGCICTMTAQGTNPRAATCFNTGPNTWQSKQFTNVPVGAWQITAKGRIHTGPNCDGSSDGPYPITVQQGGANTCCVGAAAWLLQEMETEAKPKSMDLRSLAMLITCQHCSNHRITIVTEREQVPDVGIGGTIPDKAPLRVVLVTERERRELLVKTEKGTWHATLGTLSLHDAPVVEAIAGDRNLEKLSLKVKRGNALESPCEM